MEKKRNDPTDWKDHCQSTCKGFKSFYPIYTHTHTLSLSLSHTHTLSLSFFATQTPDIKFYTLRQIGTVAAFVNPGTIKNHAFRTASKVNSLKLLFYNLFVNLLTYDITNVTSLKMKYIKYLYKVVLTTLKQTQVIDERHI